MAFKKAVSSPAIVYSMARNVFRQLSIICTLEPPARLPKFLLDLPLMSSWKHDEIFPHKRSEVQGHLAAMVMFII